MELQVQQKFDLLIELWINWFGITAFVFSNLDPGEAPKVHSCHVITRHDFYCVCIIKGVLMALLTAWFGCSF